MLCISTWLVRAKLRCPYNGTILGRAERLQLFKYIRTDYGRYSKDIKSCYCSLNEIYTSMAEHYYYLLNIFSAKRGHLR